MKTKFQTLAVVGLLCMTSIQCLAYARCTHVTGCETAQTTIRPSGCSSYDLAYGPITVNGTCTIVYDCLACSSTYHEESTTIGDTMTGTCQYTTCVENTCTNCDSTGWVAYGSTGRYESRTTATCNKATNPGTCTKSTEYRCAAGSYGTATSGTAGCTACPANATCAGGNGSTFVCNKGYYKNGTVCTACGGDATTKSTGATSQAECYIPSGTAFSDGTGSGSYTGDCYY